MIGGFFYCRERCEQRFARCKIVKMLATQGVLTYCTTRSCCGARQNVCPTERTHILPTAATRSGRFIRHWRRSHRSPLEYPHTLRVRVACLDDFIDLCQSVNKEFFDRLIRDASHPGYFNANYDPLRIVSAHPPRWRNAHRIFLPFRSSSIDYAGVAHLPGQSPCLNTLKIPG